ncbi:MAG TPA: SDR family NAD(P)-dependent oxidoreductase, partial [Vicinamibacterales bacterium]|nr:SDR family NAD(P)-dependent oxidoreductase [Vicinamibacterales bacterium]
TLRQTAVAQPALFVIEYALARFWMRCGRHPAALGGHSLGEYVAACVAGVFTLEDATRLVVARGQAMQRMPAGAMLAIALDESAMRALLPPTLALAAINGPHAVVVSGPKDDIAAFEAELDRRSIGHRRLETSHAFHSAMMDEACVEFRGQVETVMRRAPQLRMVSNLTGTWLTPEQAQSVDYWVDHLRQPVRFADCVRTLNEINVPVFLEVGPGRALTTLVRQILPATPVAHIATSLRHPQESTHDQAHLLAEMARLWTVGIEIDWRAFSAGEVRRRVTLPTYPFERQRYWVDRRFESRPSTSAITRPVNDWLLVPSWKEAADPARAVAAFSTDRPRHWLLFTDETGVSSRVASRLIAMGHHVATVAAGSSFAKHAVSAFTINPGRREDYLALAAELDQSAQRPDVVAHFWNVTANAPAEPSQTAPYLDRGFYSLIWLEQALGMGGATRRVTAVSTHTRGVDPSDVVSPVKAAIHGPLLVIPAENSASTSCAIDITAAEWLQASDADLDALVTDIAVGSDAVVAYRHGRRLTPELLPAIVPGRSSAVPPRLRHKGVYLITGGGGGIGRTIARELAARYQARIILVGRHAVSESEVERLTQAGAEVLTIAASVTDEHAMRAAVRTAVSRWGAIHGVIHAAGVAGGGLVQLKTKDAAETVFAPKVTGTQVLTAAIGDCRPDFVALCSSLASVVGSAGQVDYCAANAYLDAFAHDHAQRTGTFTVAINWDAWRDVGMAVETALPGELQRRRAATKVRGISSAEGVDVFFRILSAVSTPQVIVSTANAGDVAAGADHVGPQPALAAYARQDAADYVAPADQTEQLLAEVWQQMIGVDRVGRFDDFFKLGGHSLLATRVIAHVKQRCGVDLPLKAFFERPTLSALAERIGELQWAHSGPGTVGVADREEIEI